MGPVGVNGFELESSWTSPNHWNGDRLSMSLGGLAGCPLSMKNFLVFVSIVVKSSTAPGDVLSDTNLRAPLMAVKHNGDLD